MFLVSLALMKVYDDVLPLSMYGQVRHLCLELQRGCDACDNETKLQEVSLRRVCQLGDGTILQVAFQVSRITETQG